MYFGQLRTLGVDYVERHAISAFAALDPPCGLHREYNERPKKRWGRRIPLAAQGR